MCVGKRHLLTTARAAGRSAAPMCVGKARHVEPAERQRQGFLHIYGEGTNSQMLTTLAREVSSSIWGRHPWTAAERFPWIVFPIYIGRHRIAGGCGLHSAVSHVYGEDSFLQGAAIVCDCFIFTAR